MRESVSRAVTQNIHNNIGVYNSICLTLYNFAVHPDTELSSHANIMRWWHLIIGILQPNILKTNTLLAGKIFPQLCVHKRVTCNLLVESFQLFSSKKISHVFESFENDDNWWWHAQSIRMCAGSCRSISSALRWLTTRCRTEEANVAK